jgi:4-amino-4-deoxy-L-arabinose transferase-like glycosyltransferase
MSIDCSDAPPAPARVVSANTGGASAPASLDGLTIVAIALLVALGLFVRVWILGRTPVNSDQAVVGLMAREILHGHLFVFYWGQHYGGGEAYIVAALFALFGQSRLTLGLTPVLLDAIAALLLWRIGRRLFDPRIAVLAVLLFWVWPEVFLYLSTFEYGFRLLTLVCGLAVLLFALRLAESRSTRLRDWSGCGFFLGLGWWCSPEIVYYAAPALIWLVYRAIRRRVRPRLTGVALSLAMAALGALPWLAVNVGHGYPSMLSPVPPSDAGTWAGRLGIFFGHVAPLALGLRLRGSGDWLAGPVLGVTLYCLLSVFVLTWIVLLALKRRGGPLIVIVALFPFAYTYSPFSSYWRDGRYAVYLAPVLALLVASALCDLARRHSRFARSAPALGLIAALALTVGAAAQLAPYTPLAGNNSARPGWTSWRADPSRWLQPLTDVLEHSHVRAAYSGYWVAYALTFESHGRVLAADPGTDRYPPYLAAIARNRRQAWVFPRPSTLSALNAAVGAHPWLPDRFLTLAGFRTYLRRHDIAYRSENAGYFTIVLPASTVALPSVAAALPTRSRRTGTG